MFTRRKPKEELEEESKHHENVMQQTPMADGTNENDEVLGGNVLNMDHIKSYKHKQLLRDLSDFIDYRRAKVPEDFGTGIFLDPNNRVYQIVANTKSEDLNNKVFIDSEAFLYDTVKVKFIACDNKNYNEKISVLTDKGILGLQVWDGPIGAKTRIGMRLDGLSLVAGFTISFPDSTTQKYKVDVQMVDDNNDIVSEVMGIEPSRFTNMQQIFAFANPMPDIDRFFIYLDVDTDDEDYQAHVFHIDVLKDVNRDLLKSMSNSNMIPYQLLENPVFVKKDKTNIDNDGEDQ
jgi:hypothetical protein